MKPKTSAKAARTRNRTGSTNGSVNGFHLADGVTPEMYANLDHLITEDDTPVDNMFVEKQQKLLTEPLNSTWPGRVKGEPFLAVCNVGLFAVPKNPAWVPDVMFAYDVRPGRDHRKKQNQSYMIWILGKPPDVALEIVSDRRGGELDRKLHAYAQIGIPYYVVFDREFWLSDKALQVFELRKGIYRPIAAELLPNVGLGLRFWQGTYEGWEDEWLRWCYPNGDLVLTGVESREQVSTQLETEKKRSSRERQRVKEEKQRADQEEQRAKQEKLRADRLAERLKALGIDDVT